MDDGSPALSSDFPSGSSSLPLHGRLGLGLGSSRTRRPLKRLLDLSPGRLAHLPERALRGSANRRDQPTVAPRFFGTSPVRQCHCRSLSSPKGRNEVRDAPSEHHRLVRADRLSSCPRLDTSPTRHASTDSASPDLRDGHVRFSDAALGASLLPPSPPVATARPPSPDRQPTASPSGSLHRPFSGDRLFLPFGGLAGSGWHEQTADWTASDRLLLSRAWRTSTLSSYRAPWQRWTSWASSSGVSITDPSPQQLAQFLFFIHR